VTSTLRLRMVLLGLYAALFPRPAHGEHGDVCLFGGPKYAALADNKMYLIPASIGLLSGSQLG